MGIFHTMYTGLGFSGVRSLAFAPESFLIFLKGVMWVLPIICYLIVLQLTTARSIQRLGWAAEEGQGKACTEDRVTFLGNQASDSPSPGPGTISLGNVVLCVLPACGLELSTRPVPGSTSPFLP